jgi:hypothetical protein
MGIVGDRLQWDDMAGFTVGSDDFLEAKGRAKPDVDTSYTNPL